jgi:hypothetical protein
VVWRLQTEPQGRITVEHERVDRLFPVTTAPRREQFLFLVQERPAVLYGLAESCSQHYFAGSRPRKESAIEGQEEFLANEVMDGTDRSENVHAGLDKSNHQTVIIV